MRPDEEPDTPRFIVLPRILLGRYHAHYRSATRYSSLSPASLNLWIDRMSPTYPALDSFLSNSLMFIY